MPNIRNRSTGKVYEVTDDQLTAIQESSIAPLFEFNVSELPQHLQRNSVGMSYHLFTAIIDNLSNTTTNPPAIVVLENSFGDDGGIITVTRSGTGAFTLSSNGQWKNGKTHVVAEIDDRSNGSDGNSPSEYRVITEVNHSGNENQIFFKVVDSEDAPVNAFGKIFLEVKVKID